jgi:hypothetical protein
MIRPTPYCEGRFRPKGLLPDAVTKATVFRWFQNETELLANSSGEHNFGSAPTAHVDTQASDLLVQGGKRNQEAFGSFGLVPTGALQHVDNDAAFDFIDDLKKKRIGIIGGSARPGLARKRRQEIRQLKTDAVHDFLAADGVG